MAAIFLTGFAANLTTDLSSTATVLPINGTALCTTLGADHSYLVLNNGVSVEVAKIECVGGVLTLTRGVPAVTMTSGQCVKFEVTQSLLNEFIAQADPDAVCTVDAASPLAQTREGCIVSLSFDSGEAVSWKSGNKVFTYLDGKITCVADTSGCNLLPGTYHNATITVNADGHVCGVAAGSNIVYSQDHCCNCP